MSIQFYGRPFLSRGTYKDFNFVNDPIAKSIDEKVTFYNTDQITRDSGSDQYQIDEDFDGLIDYEIEDPDFSFVQFRSTLVARGEYIPGSEIFLVWSQGVTGSGDPMDSLGCSLDGQILGQKMNHTFLIKATYRFVL